MSGLYWGLTGSVGAQELAGYGGIRGIGAPRGCRGIREHWGPSGVLGLSGSVGV